MIYAQTIPTDSGPVRVTRADDDAPVRIEQGGVTIELAIEQAMTVVSAIGAASIFHQFPEAHRAAFNPANLEAAQ